MTSLWLISFFSMLGQLSDSEIVAYQFLRNPGVLEDTAVEVSGEVFTVEHDITGDGVIDYAVSCSTCTTEGEATFWDIYQKRDNQMILTSYGFTASKDELFHFEDAQGVHLVKLRDFCDRFGIVPLELAENRGFKTTILKDILKDSAEDMAWLTQQLENSANIVEVFEVEKLKQLKNPPAITTSSGQRDPLDAPVIDAIEPVDSVSPPVRIAQVDKASSSRPAGNSSSVPPPPIEVKNTEATSLSSNEIPSSENIGLGAISWYFLLGAASLLVIILAFAFRR